MKSIYLKFLKHLLIFSGILMVIALSLSFVLPNKFFSPSLPFLFPFFIATSLISFYFLVRTFTARFMKFINTFLLSIIIKLLLYVGIMVIYVFIYRWDAIPFLLGFFILYLCYTVFETVCIIKNSRPVPPDTTNR